MDASNLLKLRDEISLVLTEVSEVILFVACNAGTRVSVLLRWQSSTIRFTHRRWLWWFGWWDKFSPWSPFNNFLNLLLTPYHRGLCPDLPYMGVILRNWTLKSCGEQSPEAPLTPPKCMTSSRWDTHGCSPIKHFKFKQLLVHCCISGGTRRHFRCLSGLFTAP